MIQRVSTRGRLREGCQLLSGKMLAKDSTVGMSLTGALTPAGYGKSCLVPLIEAGFIDWMISTGANLYHDTHHAIGLKLHAGSPHADEDQVGVILGIADRSAVREQLPRPKPMLAELLDEVI